MTTEKIKVLIVDDSVVYRSQIRAALTDLPNIEVVGAASNGRLAVDRLKIADIDLMILDLEMPEMDGLETLKEINRLAISCKTLMFSSSSKRGSQITLEALQLGASDFIVKPDGSGSDQQSPSDKIRSLLSPKINALFPVKLEKKEAIIPPKPKLQSPAFWDLFKPKIVVIGSSTGGPTVLEKIFSNVKGPLSCPIIIIQHMPPVFTATLAERISKLSGIPAKEAVHGEILSKDNIYIVPGNYHLRLEGSVEKTTLLLDQTEQINSVRPAVDPTFESASKIFKEKCLAFVLTGMGADGKDGATYVKNNNGTVIIQEEKSCVVFGMPGAVFATGHYDMIATPDEIIRILQTKASFAPLGGVHG